MQKLMTKTLAEDTAIAMCKASIDNSINALRDAVSERAYTLIAKQIPVSVLSFHEENPNVCKSTTHAYLTTDGLSPVHIRLNRCLPDKGQGITMRIDREDYDNLIADLNSIRSLTNEKAQLQANIQSTLLGLRTAKRIKEQFPKAVPYLPDWFLSESETAIALPIDAVLSSLKYYGM